MTDLERDRLLDLLTRALDATDAADVIVYAYRDRAYRTRTVTLTVAEMGGPLDAVNFKVPWTTMPPTLTTQLLEKIMSGEAVIITSSSAR